ncbi:hypothetical protein H2199_002732 [Coniosporium tulheliwenetii]|uniref:Uncharacterized protein n=1 Tax=Coniosporium tulheliwenetii TaxID=3383036 RepID=A0ACC2ZEP9_9PEZI|nr:hypothetical protein H2199_002732 [Cladosporium sp. JES 115]
MTPPDETPVQQPQNQPPEAPAFHLTARDRQQLEADDSTFTPHSWASLAAIIRTNRLEDLLRYPSDLRRYLSWSASTRAAYGSITAFLLQERLHWTPLPSLDPEAGPQFEFVNEIPFADARDYKILRNDWPYGLEDGIVHLVVWLKTPIPTTPDTGDLTRRSRELVEGFMARVFRRAAGEGEEERGSKVLWFKNPTGLQSVRGLIMCMCL